MGTVENTIIRGNSVVGFIVASLLIIAVQIFALFPVLSAPIVSLLQENKTLLPDALYLFGFFILPLIYYIIVSLLLNPKRIISPLYTQVGTIAIFIIIFTFRMATTIPTLILTPTQSSNLMENIASTLTLWGMLLAEIALFQHYIVRWVVGVSFDSVDRKSFAVEGITPNEIIALLGKNFIETHHFTKPCQHGSVWLIKKYDYRTKNALIIAIGEQIENSNNSIIATVAYHKSMYVIKKEKTASDTQQEFLETIKARLLITNAKIKIIKLPDDKLCDDSSLIAYQEAQSITVSKLGVLSEKVQIIPITYKILIVISLIAFIGITLAQLLGMGNFLELIVAVLIALGLEIILPLRHELQSQLHKTK